MGNFCFVEEEVQNERKKYDSENLSQINAVSINLNGKEKANLGDFKKIKMLGQGSYGKVYLVELNRDKIEFYAMKIIEKKRIQKQSQLRHIQDERKILERTKSDFIVKLHYAFQNSHKLYLIVDYMAGGELYHQIKNNPNLPEDCIKFYAAEILFGLEDLHNQQIIYRDLKPENILLSETGHIKLNDFGLSKVLRDDFERADTCCGTPDYVAPEIIMGQKYTYTCDFYSLGCLMYEMLFGETPYRNKNKKLMYENRINMPIPIFNFCTDEAKDLLTRLLEVNPAKRLGNGGAKEILKHRFFSSIDLVSMRKLEIQSPYPKIAQFKNFDKKMLAQQFQFSPVVQTGNHIKLEGFTYNPSQA